MRDAEQLDLTQITPPFRMAPNSRELHGWHFRNRANTGKNTGEVNAPQHLRLFHFAPSLSGTAGYRPPEPHAPSRLEPEYSEGRGALTILDMGLADLEPDQRARMNYLRFHACLTWPKSAEETIDELNAASPSFLDEEKEIMFGCGLDPQEYELSAWILPRWIDGDLDGDGAIWLNRKSTPSPSRERRSWSAGGRCSG